jgi:hypothetical protein
MQHRIRSNVCALLLQVFMKRLELCDDPAAKEYLRYTTAQMMEGGFSYKAMFDG